MKGSASQGDLAGIAMGCRSKMRSKRAKELSGAGAIETFGIAKFNEECRSIVLRYTGEWKKTVDRMGRWVDFEHDLQDDGSKFMESVWWVFKELYDQEHGLRRL